MRGRRLWLKLATATGTLPVYVSRIEDDFYDANGETEIYAYYDRENNRLVVKQMENVSAMKQNLHHEIFHVCSGSQGEQTRWKALGCRNSESADRREEDVILFFESVQFDLLVRNGFLKYPNPPRVT